ncbi:hypothetical protein FO519_006724 [Halicephalobus sp. NKZ332]|nr:hypothetical protein FO519_006724 [Halicephalobus sp. NKZ332]
MEHNSEDVSKDESLGLQAWNDGGECTVEEEIPASGWSVEDMLKANAMLGVRSTFNEDMSQYTTCNPTGTAEEIAKADEIARAIERNAKSKRYAFLENDDEERDLDKETPFEEEAAKAANRGHQRNKGTENYRAQALRNANPPRGRQQEFTRQRDRAGYGKQGSQPTSEADGGQPQPRRSQGGDDRNSPSNASKKRTEELRSWRNEFNNAYQPPASAPANVAPPPPASADAPNGSPIQESPVVVDSSQADAPTTPSANTQESNNVTATSPVPSEPQAEKKFQFNPNAKAFEFNPNAKPFVPNVAKIPPTTNVPPLVQNYVLASMPPVSTMVPPFLPHPAVVNSSQMNQQMQAPPLIAQPGGLVMRYDMPPSYMSQNSLIVQIPPGSQPQQMAPQSMQGNMVQNMSRNGVRKMTPKGPQGQPPPQQPRMVQSQTGQPMPQPSFQNATYMPQPVYFNTMPSMPMGGPSGVPMPQTMHMPRTSVPTNQYVYNPIMVAPVYSHRPEDYQHGHDSAACSQPPTPGPGNQAASPPGVVPMNQMNPMNVPPPQQPKAPPQAQPYLQVVQNAQQDNASSGSNPNSEFGQALQLPKIGGQVFKELCRLIRNFNGCVEPYREKCPKHITINLIDASYGFLCNAGYETFMNSAECLMELDQRPSVKHCHDETLRDIERANGETGITMAAKLDRMCEALNFFSGCVRHPIRQNCGLEAWQVIFRVLKDTTKTLMPACQFTGTSPKVVHNKNHIKQSEITRPNIPEHRQPPDSPTWGTSRNPEFEKDRKSETEKPNSRRAKEKLSDKAKFSQLEAKLEPDTSRGLLAAPSLLLICALALYKIVL